MKEDQSSTDAQLKHSTKRKALMEERISMKRYSTKQMALVEERISSWTMNGSVPILTFAGRGITSLTPVAGLLPLPSPLNQHGPGSDLLQGNMEEQFHFLRQTSSNKDLLVARLAEVLKAQPTENLPVSTAISPSGAICSPLAGEIALLCPQAFTPGSVLPPSLGQYQKQIDDNAASFARDKTTSNTEAPVGITKSEEHDCGQNIHQAAAMTPETNKTKEEQGSLDPKVKMARKTMEDKTPQELITSVKSGNDERLCFCGQEDSGKMVQCENPICAFGWCHYNCVKVQRKPRRKPWFCPKCRRESELEQSKMSKKWVLGSLLENVKKREAAIMEEGCGIARLTEKEKWEATKAEWLRIAKEANEDQGSGLTQRKPTILKRLQSGVYQPEKRLGRKNHLLICSPQKSSSHDDQTVNQHKGILERVQGPKFFERIENGPRMGYSPTNICDSSPVKLKDWSKVKEGMDKLAALKRKEKELKNKMLKSFGAELKLKDELVSVREEMTLIMNKIL